ncbi:hypothetical protein PSTG_11111 [Puccinia striiformis f. sp. tritici PST-78]|uniref:Secreted protein n=1 Tax=Puccinia striiformis f. sp. tritici PST-78 TaxID=1165861 RepID=A0A0L0V8V3_9BASI|nr:hypothetical protein PSTG_11111 [Puccinia striiformis f. sp. tritici PST-78]
MNFLGSAILFVALAGPLVAGQQYFRCGAAAPYGHCGSNNSHAVPPTWDSEFYSAFLPSSNKCPADMHNTRLALLKSRTSITIPGLPPAFHQQTIAEQQRDVVAFAHSLLLLPLLTVNFGSLITTCHAFLASVFRFYDNME